MQSLSFFVLFFLLWLETPMVSVSFAENTCLFLF